MPSPADGGSIPIRAGLRYRLFVFSALLSFLLFALFLLFLNVPFMAIVVFLGGLFNAVVNVLLQTVMQLNVPADMRGKVFSLLGALSQGLAPIAMALGGVLAGFIPLLLLFFIAFVLPFFTLLPLFAQRDFKNFFTTEPAREPQSETG